MALPNDPGPIRRKQPLTALWLDALRRLVLLAGSLRVEAPLDMQVLPWGGRLIRWTRMKPIPARLTGYNSTTGGYSWVEVRHVSGSTWSAVTGGRSGTDSAFEANRAGDLVANPTTGTVVELKPGFGGADWRFQIIRTGGSLPTCTNPINVTILVVYCNADVSGCTIEVYKGAVLVASGPTTYNAGSGSRQFLFTTLFPGDYTVIATPDSSAVDGPRTTTMTIPSCVATWTHYAGFTAGNTNSGLKADYACCALGAVPKTLNCTIGSYSLTLTYQLIPVNASTSSYFWYGMFRTNIIPTLYGAAATSSPTCNHSSVNVVNNIHVLFTCGGGSGNHTLLMTSKYCGNAVGGDGTQGIWYDQVPLDLVHSNYYGQVYTKSTIPRPATVDITLNYSSNAFPLGDAMSPAVGTTGSTARVYA